MVQYKNNVLSVIFGYFLKPEEHGVNRAGYGLTVRIYSTDDDVAS